jgi:hypothetical protein
VSRTRSFGFNQPLAWQYSTCNGTAALTTTAVRRPAASRGATLGANASASMARAPQ